MSLRNKAMAAGGKKTALVLTLLVHLLFVIFLFYSVRWQHTVTAVSVELYSPSVPAVETIAEPESSSTTQTVSPLPEPSPVAKEPKAEIAVDKKKPEKLVPAKPATVPPSKSTKEHDYLEEALKREQDQLNNHRLSKELGQAQAAQARQLMQSAQAAWAAKFRAKIRSNVVLPSEIRGNPEAIFEVTQLPSGEVIGVKLRQSSGYGALDQAIERAILKSNPLPKPDDLRVFERNLLLSYRPAEIN
jgi:colicin import membrane protein